MSSKKNKTEVKTSESAQKQLKTETKVSESALKQLKTEEKSSESAQKQLKTETKVSESALKQLKIKKASEKNTSSSKKKLLIPTDGFLPRWDGISRFLSEIIPRLKKKYDISIIAPDNGRCEFDEDSSLKIVRIPLAKYKGGDFNPPKFDYKTIKKEVKKTDIVFSQTLGPIGLLGVMAARKYKKKLLFFVHLIEWDILTKAIGISFLKKYVNFITKMLTRRAYKKANILIVPSENIAEMLTWQKINTPKEIVYLGVETNKFVPPKNKRLAKTKLGIDPETFVIGYHGRIAREKDIPTLLRAFIQLKKVHQNVKLLIVGDGLDSIKKKLASIEGVILPGQTNNVIPFLQAMDVYCLTSLTETTSLGTLEAMSCEVPAIATKVGFVKQYLKPKINGLFFKEKNSYDLMKKIVFMITHKDQREKMGKTARKVVEKNFNWDSTTKQLEKIIDGLLD